MTTMEERVARLDAVLPQMNERIGNLEQDVRRLNDKMDAGFVRLETRIDAGLNDVRQEMNGLRGEFSALQWRITGIVAGMAVAVVVSVVSSIILSAV